MSLPVAMVSGDPIAVLGKLKYTLETIEANMFSEAKEDKMKVMVPPVRIPGVCISRLWEGVFADGSTFLQRYHDKRNEKNLVVGNWVLSPDKGSGFRFVSLTTIVEVPRAGTETPLNEAHRFCYVKSRDDKLLLVYHISSQTPNVPFGTSFRTEALCHITADNETSDCTIAFWGKCRGMSFQFKPIQYIAEPRAIREMAAAYKVMVEMMVEEIAGAKAEIVAAVEEEVVVAAASDRGGGAVDPAFQAAILGLGLFVAVLTFFSLRSIMRSTRITTRLATQPASAWVGNTLGWTSLDTAGGGSSGASRKGRGGNNGLRNANGATGVGGTPPSSALSYIQSSHIAANDAEMQSLRYRYVEQRGALSTVESNVQWLWWVVFLQGMVIIGLSVFVCLTRK